MPQESVDENTNLLGGDALLDSLALAITLIDVEDRVREELGISLVLTDERALSRSQSPFRTVSSLIDYTWELLSESSK